MTIPVLNQKQFHEFHVLGNATGTISIREATFNTSDIIYSIKFNTPEPDLLKKVLFYYPRIDSGEINSKTTSFVIVLSRDDSRDRRLEVLLGYEIVITVPPRLKCLHVTAHSASHVEYVPKINHGRNIQIIIDKYDVQTRKKSDLEMPQIPLRLSVDQSWFADEMFLAKRSQVLFSRASLPVQLQSGMISVSVYSPRASPRDGCKGEVIGNAIPLTGDSSKKLLETTTMFTVIGAAQGLATIMKPERRVGRTVKWDEVVQVCTEGDYARDAIHWEPYNKKARWNWFISVFGM